MIHDDEELLVRVDDIPVILIETKGYGDKERRLIIRDVRLGHKQVDVILADMRVRDH